MKRTLVSSVVIVIGGILNFLVFLIAYKRLAFPYLNEAQHVENAPFIVFYILPMFFGIAVVIFFANTWVAVLRNKCAKIKDE